MLRHKLGMNMVTWFTMCRSYSYVGQCCSLCGRLTCMGLPASSQFNQRDSKHCYRGDPAEASNQPWVAERDILGFPSPSASLHWVAFCPSLSICLSKAMNQCGPNLDLQGPGSRSRT